MSQPLRRMVIERARTLVADRRTWTTGRTAATARNESLSNIMDARAQRFCARGALQRAAYELVGPETYWEVAQAARQALLPGGCIMLFNDQEGRKAVLRLFDTWLAKDGAVER